MISDIYKKNEDTNISVVDWIKQHNIKTEDGKPVSFDDYPFMMDIYEDLSPQQAIIKPAQIGATTMHIIKAFWIARHLGVNGLYSLPTFNDVKDFMKAKMNRLIEQNPYFQELIQMDDTIGQKVINISKHNRPYILMRGCHTAPTMFSADILYGDEVDSSNQTFFDQMYTRLQASDLKWQFYFSHPSAPNVGVDKYFQMSDKREWFIDCPCGNHFYLSWAKHANPDRHYRCDQCNEIITTEMRRNGKWEPTTEGKWRGYHISLMMHPRYSCDDLWVLREEKDDYYFMTRVLGLPLNDESRSVNQETIFKNCTQNVFQTDTESRMIIAVDPGKIIRYTMGNKQGLFHYAETEDYKDIEKFMDVYPEAVMVCDGGGESYYNRLWQEKYKGRVWLVHYSQDRAGEQMVRWDDEHHAVVVEVNRCIDEVINNFRAGRLKLQGTKEEWWDYWLHWKSMYATVEENAIGVPKKIWKTTWRKDFCSCTVFHLIAASRFKEKGKVLTSFRL